MKLRLAQPRLLIDIGRIKDLSYIREAGNQILIGAMTTHYQLESSATLKQACPLLPECASHIGDLQVRNKGTIGGSLAHADPAGDWPAAILALRAELMVVGPGGERRIKADDFFIEMLTTALEPNEILREIRITRPSGRFGQSYQKVHHPASGFAVVGVAVTLTVATDGSCESVGVGVTGVSPKPYRAQAVEQTLLGKRLDQQTIGDAATYAVDAVEVNSELYASDEYRRHLARIYTRRALQSALSQANRRSDA